MVRRGRRFESVRGLLESPVNQGFFLIRATVTHFHVGGAGVGAEQRDLDRGDQVAMRENVLQVGSIARDTVELGQRDAPFAVCPKDVHEGIERDQRYAEI